MVQDDTEASNSLNGPVLLDNNAVDCTLHYEGDYEPELDHGREGDICVMTEKRGLNTSNVKSTFLCLPFYMQQ